MTTTHHLAELLDRFEERPDARALRQRSYRLLRLRPGAAVVDVGCGTGRAVAELADLAARPTGVDVDDELLAAARRRGDFRRASAERLPFDDGALAGYRAEGVYDALPDPAGAATEARRVLEPGGRIVLLGQDWDALVVDSADPALTRTLVHARADAVAQPRAARGYRSLLLDAGFTEVSVDVATEVVTDPELALPVLTDLAHTAVSEGGVDAEEAESWLDDQHDRADADRMLVAFPVFVAAATNRG